MSWFHTVSVPQLNRVLTANAVFSLCSGLILLAAAEPLAALLGAGAPLLYRIVGAGLLLFAADIVWHVRKGLSFAKGLYFVLGDFLWVAASAYLLFARPHVFSAEGRLIMGLVALIVLGFGACQDVYLFRARRAPA